MFIVYIVVGAVMNAICVVIGAVFEVVDAAGIKTSRST